MHEGERFVVGHPGAEIDSKPELEIYADDVKCSHGSTTGQLDPAALFYLRSRGLGEREARSALTRACKKLNTSPTTSVSCTCCCMVAGVSPCMCIRQMPH